MFFNIWFPAAEYQRIFVSIWCSHLHNLHILIYLIWAKTTQRNPKREWIWKKKFKSFSFLTRVPSIPGSAPARSGGPVGGGPENEVTRVPFKMTPKIFTRFIKNYLQFNISQCFCWPDGKRNFPALFSMPVINMKKALAFKRKDKNRGRVKELRNKLPWASPRSRIAV